MAVITVTDALAELTRLQKRIDSATTALQNGAIKSLRFPTWRSWSAQFLT